MNSSNTFYVAFIDILGYSKLVSEYFEDENTNKSLLKNIETIIDEAFRLDELMLKKLSSKVIFVSDSLIISIERNSEDYHELNMLFAFLSYFQSKCLYEGIYIRGAISEGPHYEKENVNYQVLISKALVRAVKTEKETFYPRIVIDQPIMNELYKKGKIGNYAFINIEDDCHFIDFYNGIVTWYFYYEKRESLNAIISKIFNDVTRQIELNHQNANVIKKHEWILKYLSWRSGKPIELEGITMNQNFKRMID